MIYDKEFGFYSWDTLIFFIYFRNRNNKNVDQHSTLNYIPFN